MRVRLVVDGKRDAVLAIRKRCNVPGCTWGFEMRASNPAVGLKRTMEAQCVTALREHMRTEHWQR